MTSVLASDEVFCLMIVGIPHRPDYVRRWFRWKPACKQHGLVFGDVWEYAEHWHTIHEGDTQ